MKPVGKPDAGNPHVRFDERGGETELPQAVTAPFLDSTRGKRALRFGGQRGLGGQLGRDGGAKSLVGGGLRTCGGAPRGGRRRYARCAQKAARFR